MPPRRRVRRGSVEPVHGAPAVRVRDLGLQEYGRVWRAMREFTEARRPQTADEFWLVQHPPVFTLGQAGREVHVLAPGNIPLVHTDRGGQVTFHAPGQVVLYTLLNLRRLGIGVRSLVEAIESAVIALLAEDAIGAARRDGAPGVYVGGAKVAALGLRVRNACTYHGVALNVDLDLEPFSRINPCGFEGLAVTSLRRLGSDRAVLDAGHGLARTLAAELGLTLGETGVAVTR